MKNRRCLTICMVLALAGSLLFAFPSFAQGRRQGGTGGGGGGPCGWGPGPGQGPGAANCPNYPGNPNGPRYGAGGSGPGSQGSRGGRGPRGGGRLNRGDAATQVTPPPVNQ